jgi:hypothetical protein
MCTFLLQQLFHVGTHDGASAKFSTNSHETVNSVAYNLQGSYWLVEYRQLNNC